MTASPRTLFLIVLIGGLVVRLVRLAMNGPLWGDEAMLIRSLLDRSPGEFFQPLDYAQLAPLGFLWIEQACSQWLGMSEWVWRLTPTLAGCAALLMFARLATRMLPRHAAWLAVGIMASSIYLIRHTVEAKPYIIDFTVAVLLLELGWSIQERPDRMLRWLGFGLVAALGVWCSYPSVFAAGGVLLGLLPCVGRGWWVVGRGLGREDNAAFSNPQPTTHNSQQFSKSPALRIISAWLLCGAALSGSFVAMYLLFGRVQMQVADQTGYWNCSMWEVAYPPWQRPDLLVWWLIREHTGTMMAHPFGGKNFASAMTAALVAAGVITLGLGRWSAAGGPLAKNVPFTTPNPQPTTHNRLLWLLLAPALLGFIAACMKKYPYGGTARTMLYLAPAICLLAGLGGWAMMVRWLPAARRRPAWSLAMLGCIGIIVTKLVLEVTCPYKMYSDWQAREIVQTWAADAGPDDVWIIANASTQPERKDAGIYGGVTVAVLDHYAILAGQREWPAVGREPESLLHLTTHHPQPTTHGDGPRTHFSVLHPRRIIDFPPTGGRVSVIVMASTEEPFEMDIAELYRKRFAPDAELLSDESLPIGRTETLRRMVFVGKSRTALAVHRSSRLPH